MPRWTEEQQLAIEKDGSNIIVSAGAGSGKTAVLSERVIRKINDGVNVDELLLLTFTKAAAFEMMIRIRNKIKDRVKNSVSDEERKRFSLQLSKIDSAYITTFDSFSLSLVKKYHYILNVSKDIKIINQTIIDIKLKEIINNIFDRYYELEDSNFLKLIDNFTLKDDSDIKSLIINMSKKLDLKYDKVSYLENYISNNFNDSKIDSDVLEFENYLLSKIRDIKYTLENISLEVDGDYYEKISESLNGLINSRSYDDIIKYLEIKLPMLPKNSSDYLKNEKEKLSGLIKDIKSVCKYESISQIKKYIKDTSCYIKIIIDIILELDNEINLYKKEHDSYEFTDISKLAIKLVKENDEICNEIRDSFNEIMIDEYQDTSDLQEEFISCIANNNVYMVGDIKQSIYRFRNANPYIFKNKYDNYAKNDGGFKIDLIKNFRSRKEVLNNINYIFNYIMDDMLGGCKYREEHQMVFGNLSYEENKDLSNNYDFDILNYQVDKDSKFNKNEIEIFTVLRDIENKIKNNYQVIDKETNKLRNATYSDFAILIDRASKFELYKKIFEYYNVPLTVYKDTSITSEDDIYIINNILRFIRLVKNKDYSEEFKYLFISIGRSYLFSYDDNYIFNIVKDNSYYNTSLYDIVNGIVKDYDILSINQILTLIIDKFEFYNKQILVGGIDNLMARVSYIDDLFKEYVELGYSNDEIIDNFSTMVVENYDIKVSFSNDSDDGVKIMTIHKSKGLEFPILYLTGLSNKFNVSDLNEKFIYDNKYGFIVPFYDNREIINIKRPLLRNRYLNEEIGEKIRLFYVALTRAKEKMIFVTSVNDEVDSVDDLVDNSIRVKYLSFMDIIKSIWGNLNDYKKDISIESLNISRDYNYIKENNIDDNLDKCYDQIIYNELNIDNSIIDVSSYSKKMNELINEDVNKAIEFGKRMHYIFETINFMDPDYSNLNDFEKDKVSKFLELDILKDIKDDKIYKEYEFIYEDGNEKKNGVIDLLIEKDNEILIIDYKLKNIDDDAYLKQLNGYKKYISSKSDKKVGIYLYSIIDGDFKEL